MCVTSKNVGALLLFVGSFCFIESAIVKPNPIISRGTGVTVKASSGEVACINDNNFGAYATARWTISDNSWVAIKVAAGTYSKVFIVWNCPDTSWTDSIALAKDSCKNIVSYPGDYDILTSSNSTNGTDGDWTPAVSVKGNNVASRGHFVDFAGAAWIKMNIIKGKGKFDEIEVFDASNGAEDTWFFLGTKFTALMFKGKKDSGYKDRDTNVADSSFVSMITRRNPTHTPAIIRGGNFCRVTTGDVVRDISKYLAVAGNVHFWAIELGTFDAWGGKADSAAAFKTNLQIIIDSCKAHGIQPIIPRIPSTKSNAGWQVHADFLKAVDDLVKTNQLIPGPDLYAYFKTQFGAMDLDSKGVLPNDFGNFEAQREWVLRMDSLVYKKTVEVASLRPAITPVTRFTLHSRNGRLVLDADCPGTACLFSIEGRIVNDIILAKAGRYTLASAPGYYLVKINSINGTTETLRAVNY
ncbi:MAG: hypothetical protein JW913_17885 [Chitinispirillaceae bacterium]|nr:hypothetical protein [Chitinispirillaceae bacterium]